MKVLLVGMVDSIHLSRWLAQFDSSDIKFELISSSPHRRIQAGVTQRVKESSRVTMTWFSRHFSLLMWTADRLLSDWLRGSYIAWRIHKFQPDIVHAHELQNAGYATRRAYQLLRRKRPKLIVTNYGSEIVWFSKYPRHKKKLRALLEITDGFSAECSRDYDLAAELASGFQKLPLMPVAGGFARNLRPEEARNKITIKGYENHWGKAIVVLEALAEISTELQDMELVLYSCNKPVFAAAKKVSRETGLKIETFKKGALSHPEVLELFRTSLIYVGHSLSDGISTSMLEAMAMGAIPIQTSTSCADEWVLDGETGFLVEPNDAESIKAAVISVVNSSFDSDSARLKSYQVIESRYDPMKLSALASTYYENFRK
jgi:glycosyltransferase involved in cell wall biosynthesis